jgi:hypothetical protein
VTLLTFPAFHKTFVGPACKALMAAAALVAAQTAAAGTLVHNSPLFGSYGDGTWMLLTGLGLMGFVARRRGNSRDDSRDDER